MNSNKRTSSMDLSPNMDLLLDSTTSLYNTSKFEKSSDEDIEKLLKKMENLLSPHDHSVFDSNGNKSVGDILKAADELIHSSSPLFEALSPTDSQNISGTSHISSKSFKIDIPQLPVFNKSFALKSNDINTDANETKRITNKVTPDTPQENDNVDNNINVTPANPIANINKENMTLDIENKNIPAMKLKEENPKPNNANESNINNDFQFQDIVNLTRPDKPSGVSTTKPHSKYDKHRQLNYKTDRDKKVKTSQLIPKHKSENRRAKSGQDMKMKNTDPTKESSKIVKQQTSLEKNVDKKKSPMLNNEMKNTSQTNIEKNNEIENFPSPNKKLNLDEQNVNMPHTNKNNDSTLHSVGHLTSQNTLLKTNNEPGHDLESDIHSLTRTLSPTTESHWSGGLRDVIINNGKPELKMSDLVTPSRGSQSLEQELEIQKNKVRQLKDELNNTVKFHLQQLESMKISHEEELVMMKRQMKVEQETELKRRLLTRTPGMDKATTPLDDHLLSSYDKENKRLCQEIKSLKIEFREAENKWAEEKSKLILQLDQNETDSLKKQLKEARIRIQSLEQTIHLLKAKEEDGDASDVIQKLEHQNFQLMNEICELTKKINDSNAKSADVLQGKDEEIQRLNNELKQFSASNGSQEETSVVKDLRAQLSEERAQLKAVSAEKEVLAKDNYDLRRQVKELEIIVKKRNTTGCLTITGQEFFPETEKIKQLESQLADKDKLIEKLTQNVNVTTEKYKANLEQLENQLKCESDKVKAESEKLRKLKAAHTKEIEEVKKATKKSNNKDDAHLLATIRGLQSELLNKEKLMAKINKELDDVKKTNRTLQKEREKILSSKNDSKHSSTQSLKNVGVPLPSPEHSAEMARLKQKIKELEDDIVTLHEKASYDMEMVKEQHCAELNAAKSSQGNVAELEGQIYTQEIIITHLKQKLVQLEALQNSHTMLKLENEKLEKLLTQANSTIAKLEQPVNPLDPGSSSQSQTVLSKIDYLEKRHEVREKTLQAIIHELLSDKKVNTQCMGDCQSKLLDKNREICYYRAEMDRILDSLRQYKQTH